VSGSYTQIRRSAAWNVDCRHATQVKSYDNDRMNREILTIIKTWFCQQSNATVCIYLVTCSFSSSAAGCTWLNEVSVWSTTLSFVAYCTPS